MQKAKPQITVEWVVEELRRLIDNEEVPYKDKLSALKMMGDYLKMFQNERRVSVDVRGIVAQLSTDELKRITHKPQQALTVTTTVDQIEEESSC